MRIVLIRHGEAESVYMAGSDMDRALTTYGRSLAEAILQKALADIEVTDDSQLWVSPARRARQTARIAKGILGMGKPTLMDALYYEDEEAVLGALSESDADTVVIVAHMPLLGELCHNLTGDAVGIDTGAVVIIDVDDEEVPDIGERHVGRFERLFDKLDVVHTGV